MNPHREHFTKQRLKMFPIYMNKIPLESYTLSVFIFPQRIVLSNPMIAAMAPSIFSVDFSLSALMFPAGFVRMKILSIIQRKTG